MRSIALDVHRTFCEVAIKDGAQVRSGGRTRKDREREREFAEQSEIAYRRLVQDWQAKPKTNGAGATPGRAS